MMMKEVKFYNMIIDLIDIIKVGFSQEGNACQQVAIM